MDSHTGGIELRMSTGENTAIGVAEETIKGQAGEDAAQDKPAPDTEAKPGQPTEEPPMDRMRTSTALLLGSGTVGLVGFFLATPSVYESMPILRTIMLIVMCCAIAGAFLSLVLYFVECDDALDAQSDSDDADTIE